LKEIPFFMIGTCISGALPDNLIIYIKLTG
jgi:hypothetical protein